MVRLKIAVAVAVAAGVLAGGLAMPSAASADTTQIVCGAAKPESHSPTTAHHRSGSTIWLPASRCSASTPKRHPQLAVNRDSVVSDLIPVLWLCGPPGIGKSTVGWEIFTQLTQAGIEAGYVDIDQLGICIPKLHRIRDGTG